MNADQIQALKKPLLDDDERKARFFELLPEIPFSDFLNELNASCRFNENAQEMLEAYLEYLRKPTAQFEDEALGKEFTAFNKLFRDFNDFLESNFFTEGNLNLLQPYQKIQNHSAYALRKRELQDYCLQVAETYKKLVSKLASVRPDKKSPRSSISYANGKMRYGEDVYEPTSKAQKKMLDILWEYRTRKRTKSDGFQLDALAVQLGKADDVHSVTVEVRKSLRDTIKLLNRYLRDKRGYPIEFKVRDGHIFIYVS